MANHRTHRFRLAGALAILAIATSLHSQETAPSPRSIEDALHQMSDLAGIIFVGEVTAVRHRTGEQGASGLVEVDFRIDQAVRGCNSGATFTLREWAGLWQGGDERYRPGQRFLMLLHPLNPAGITSPVGGMNGAIPIRAGTASSLVSSAASAPASASSVADLRWIGTRLLRNLPYTASTSLTTGQVIAASTSDSSAGDSSVAAEQTSVAVVVNMLTNWQQAVP